MDAATIEQEALSLSSAERALLADKLLQTLESENEANLARWGEEADKRLQVFEAGQTKAVDVPAALAHLKEHFG